MNFFKRVTTLTRINDSIYELEKNLLLNQHNLDHFQAMVNSNMAALKRLRAMRELEIAGNPPPPPKVEPKLEVKPAKPRAVA